MSSRSLLSSRCIASFVLSLCALFVATAVEIKAQNPGSPEEVRLADSFDDGALDTSKWFIGTLSLFQGEGLTDFSIPVTEQSGHLQIAPKSSVFGLHYNGYVSKNNFDFSGGRFTVEIVEIPNPSSTGEMFVSVGADGNNFWRFEIHMGQLRADFKTNGFTSYYPLGQYSSSDHKFLRIRHDPFKGLILWEASSNNVQWTTLHTEIPGFALTRVQAELFAGTYTSAFAPGLAVFDNAELSNVFFSTNQPPLILTQPQSQTVPLGKSATFTVDAVSVVPFGYQWYFNSFFIAGATSAVFTIPSVQANNVGLYRVVVSNKYGIVVSSPGQLNLPAGDSEAPAVTISSPSSGVVFADRITVEGTATDNVAVTSLYLERENGDKIPVPLQNEHFSLSNVSLQRGTNTLRVVALDAVGNQSWASVVIVFEASRLASIPDIQPVQEGALLTFPILLASKGDVGAITLDLSYEPAFLTLTDVQFSSALATWTQANTQNVGRVRLGFALPGTTLPAGTQTVATATFRTRGLPQSLSTPLNLQLVGIYSAAGDSISGGTDVRSGTAHISRRKFIGDNNANDLLDVGDASIIMRLVSGIDPVRSWDITGNDLNQNQTVDAGDVIRVLRTAVNIDPQPTNKTQSGRTQKAVSITAASLNEETRLISDKLNVSPGDSVTLRLILEGRTTPVYASSFKVTYPSGALRLEDAQSHHTGALVPSNALALWNLSPFQNDYAKQDGLLYAAFSSPLPWPTNAGELAAFTFTVQPGATNIIELPLKVSDLLLSDGFDVAGLASAEIILHGQAAIPLELSGPVYDSTSNTFSVKIKTTVGLRYRVDSSEDLNVWSEMATYTADTPELVISDQAPKAGQKRFYRAVQLL